MAAVTTAATRATAATTACHCCHICYHRWYNGHCHCCLPLLLCSCRNRFLPLLSLLLRICNGFFNHRIPASAAHWGCLLLRCFWVCVTSSQHTDDRDRWASCCWTRGSAEPGCSSADSETERLLENGSLSQGQQIYFPVKALGRSGSLGVQ